MFSRRNSQPKSVFTERSSRLIAAMVGDGWFVKSLLRQRFEVSSKLRPLNSSNCGAYLPEFGHIKDWSHQHSFICDINLNNLESQPRLTSGRCRTEITVPR